VLLRLFILVVTVIALVGGVRTGASMAAERPAHTLAGADAAGAPDLDPDADTGGEAVVLAAGEAQPRPVVRHLCRPNAPIAVGRQHPMRLFRPPEKVTTGSFSRT
jgi:hypothetical protein